MEWFMKYIKTIITLTIFLGILGTAWHLKADQAYVEQKFDSYDYRNTSQDYYDTKNYIKALYEELKYAESDRERARIKDDIQRAERDFEELKANKEKIHKRLKEK